MPGLQTARASMVSGPCHCQQGAQVRTFRYEISNSKTGKGPLQKIGPMSILRAGGAAGRGGAGATAAGAQAEASETPGASG